MNNAYITASELANYVYCECCWADKLEGNTEQTEEMMQGVKAHDHLQWLYTSIQFLKRIAIVIVIGSLVLLAVFLIMLFLTGNL